MTDIDFPLTIRPEQSGDHRAIYEVNRRAFQSSTEAELVKALRHYSHETISLVALKDDQLVGHILFTPVSVPGDKLSLPVMALGPMAVAPAFQRQGIGSQLVTAGLEACRAAGKAAVVVLGHREYYPRFGFRPAAEWNLHFKSPAFDPYFMALELVAEGLAKTGGDVEYLPEFDDV